MTNMKTEKSKPLTAKFNRWFMNRIFQHWFRSALKHELFGDTKEKNIFPRRPNWFSNPLYRFNGKLQKRGMKTIPDWAIKPFDWSFIPYYAAKDAFWDACVIIAIKTGKLKL